MIGEASSESRLQKVEEQDDSDNDDESFLPEEDTRSTKNAAAYWL